VTESTRDGRTVQPAVQFIDGAVELAGRPVLRGIDLTVVQGEVLAVLGANGAGKSTLVRAAVGLPAMTGGEVRLFGTPLRSYRDWSRIGYAPQRVTAGSGVPATVEEVVASGRLARRRPFRRLRDEDRESVRRALTSVDLSQHARHDVSHLSGGQQQRVLVARALATDADLLLLDEPASGVDAPTQAALAAALVDLAGRGVTVVVVAHQLGPLEPMVSRAVVLRSGRIVYDGPPPAVRVPGHAHLPADEHEGGLLT